MASRSVEPWTVRIDKIVHLLVPVLLGLSGWALLQIWSLEARMTRIETLVEVTRSDLSEMKADIRFIRKAISNQLGVR